eukprot:scaffold4121_cov381-Prasinococcus_capsulatus_cf.AAC.5
MARRALTNKVLMYGIIAFLLGAIGLIIYFKLATCPFLSLVHGGSVFRAAASQVPASCDGGRGMVGCLELVLLLDSDDQLPQETDALLHPCQQ